MTKEGCLSRIEIYKKHGNSVLLEKEEEFLKANYSEQEKPKAVKKDKIVKE